MEIKPVMESPGSAEPEELRNLLKHIIGSRTFNKSPRLCSLLEFITENSLSGNLENLTEQQIGIQVFKRSPGYNSGEDTIVRGTARLLRQRLEQYYQDEGRNDSFRITIPKGGYVAHFGANTEAYQNRIMGQLDTISATDPGSARSIESERTGWPASARILVSLCSALAIFSPLGIYFWMQSSQPALPAKGPQPLWHALFMADRKTIIVPGDASLDAYIAWEQRSVSLEDYANQNYQHNVTNSRPPSKRDVPLSIRSVTPMADLRLVSELVRVPERMGMPALERNMEIRYARDIAIADTHDNNLILIGSETFNPWVTLYQLQMDFVAHWDFVNDIYVIDNKAPKKGEQEHYYYDRRKSDAQNAFTHVAFVENSQGQGNVLVVEGTTMGTTYGAVNFFNQEQLWKPVIDAATGPAGHICNFEVLLSGGFVHGGVSNTRIIAIHIH